MIIKYRKSIAWLAILSLIATSVGMTVGYMHSNHWSAIFQFLVLIPIGFTTVNMLRASIVMASEQGIFIRGRFYSTEEFSIKEGKMVSNGSSRELPRDLGKMPLSLGEQIKLWPTKANHQSR